MTNLDHGSDKKATAARLIADAVRDGDGWISTQVVREFANVMLKKSGRSVSDIKTACAVFDRFKVVEDTMPLAFRGLEVKEQFGTQYFDALIVATAEKGLCEVLYSEDLSDGQTYCGVRVVNPFRQ